MIDLRKELNSSQYKAASCTEGPLIILAGAGSGKTRTVTYRIAHMIEDKGIRPENILAVTFTNKAAGEMKERISKLLGSDTTVTMATFHSLCYKILRQCPKVMGYRKRVAICDDGDQKARMKEILKRNGFETTDASEILRAISRAKDKLIMPPYGNMKGHNFDEFRSKYGQSIASVYETYQRELVRDNVLDFDDLITQCALMFSMRPDVLGFFQDRYRYISVDEYQDTSHAQYVFINALAKKYRNLCVVGDDYQSIYKFRGADISNILSFEEDYPDAVTVTLPENYRSTQVIVNAASAVIRNNEHQKHKDLESMNDTGEKIRVIKASNEIAEAEKIVSLIEQAETEGCKLSECAILYRNNRLSKFMEKALRAHSIPYRIYGSVPFYERREVKDILAHIKVIAGTSDRYALKRAMSFPKKGIGEKTIGELFAYLDRFDESDEDIINTVEGFVQETNNKKIAQFCDLIRKYRLILDTKSASETIEMLLQEMSFHAYLKSICKDPDEELNDKIGNTSELLDDIRKWELDNLDAPLSDYIESIAVMTDKEAAEKADMVQLMTMHKSKGLEFDRVFICALEQRIMPGSFFSDEDSGEMLEESRRLFYVAMTRARHLLTLSYSESRFWNGSADWSPVSQFISEIPEEYCIYSSV